MGYWKNHLIDIQERGYGDSYKVVCASCIPEPYISKRIRGSNRKGKCDFCGKRRNVLAIEDVLDIIMPVIRGEYESADENAPWDSEEGRYLSAVTTIWEYINYELNDYLQIQNDSLLKEISNTITDKIVVSKYNYSLRPFEEDLVMWNEYCRVVKESPLSAEQIVSLDSKEIGKLPETIKYILSTLHVLSDYFSKINLIRPLYGITSHHKPVEIFRCVNYLGNGPTWSGLAFIPASFVGTAPAKLTKDNRMSERGDMMFYGALNHHTAMIEVGRNSETPDFPGTVGKFVPNKMFKVLDLSRLEEVDEPSVFDAEREEERNLKIFLREFARRISEQKDENDKVAYKPTQVLTKYIQRKTHLQGIMYNSSKDKALDAKCCVLFVTNRNCLDSEYKRNDKHNQLIMTNVTQYDFCKEGL